MRSWRAAQRRPVRSVGCTALPQAIKDVAPDGRHPHDLRLAPAARLRADARRPDGAAHEGGRLHRHRQDQHARVRPRLAHLQRGVRRHAQRLRPARGPPAAAAAARRWRWPRACCRWPTAATSWAACAIRRDGTTSSAFARARAACRCGRRRTSGSRSSAPKGRWGAPCATSRCCSTCRPATTRACRCRCQATNGSHMRSTTSTCSGRAHRLARRPRRLPADGSAASSTVCEQGLHRLQGLGCAVEPTRLGLRARRSLAGVAGLAALAGRVRESRHTWSKPQNRALIKPEALWEYDQAAQLSGSAGRGGKRTSAARSTSRCSPVRALTMCSRCRRRRSGRLTRRPALADAHRTGARWTPTTAGWRS